MKVYIKEVKKHEEVWGEDVNWGESRIKICLGNSNYGRLYVSREDVAFFLSEDETTLAFELFGQIWEKNKDNHPFGE